MVFVILLTNQLVAQKVTLDQEVQQVYKAIVRIEVVSESGSGGRMKKSRSTGSGVIIRKDGLVVTNHHVAGKATRLTCRLYDGEEVMADLLGADAMTDLAVLKLRTNDRPADAKSLTIAKFADSDSVRVGDVCFAMGSPAGLTQSVTRGIISNLAMISPSSGSFRLDGENVGELVRWLGHDAVIFPGNSGGPLVDKKGGIIGINEVGIGSLGGAIPANLAHKVSLELAENGFVSRAWTGLECQPNLDPNLSGILISGVIKIPLPIRRDWFRRPDHSLCRKESECSNSGRHSSFQSDLLWNWYWKKVQIKGVREGKPKNGVSKQASRESAFSKEKELKSWGSRFEISL